MAITHRRVHIANPARNRRRRRNMSAKQIKFFGSPAQKAALKRSRAAKRKRPNPRHRTRKNFGETLVSLSLGAANPARKKRKVAKMAATHRRRAKRTNRARTTTRRRRRRTTAVVHHRRRTTMRSNPRRRRNPVVRHRRHSYRRNPLGAGWGQTFMEGSAVLAGILGSKYLAQMVLGTSNASFVGYAANLAVGGIGGWAAGSLLKKPKLGQSFFVGSVIEVIVRVLEDYTPVGAFIQSVGVGDYFASNFVTPQHYVNPLNSAQVGIPAGWAPTTVIQSASAPAGSLAGIPNSGFGNFDGM
jgi:hypothetical protein